MATKEWFVSALAETDIPHKEAIAVLLSAEVGATTAHLIEAKEEHIESLMTSLALKAKEKAKIRRALRKLCKATSKPDSTAAEPIKPSSTTTAEANFTEDNIEDNKNEQVREVNDDDDTDRQGDCVHDVNYQSARREVPRSPGTFIVPTENWARKTIMLVGETGCGKSTTLNSMVSYLWGVDLNDHYRFVLVPPPSSLSAQAHSVTNKVKMYQLRPPKLVYGLNVIDTPGFGDTKGLGSDLKTIDDIEQLLCNQVDSIDAIFLIVRSSGRLDAHMKYIFNSVLRLFGKDVVNNMFTLVTFADGSEPPILAALAEAKIPAKQIFELNNSAFFNGFDPDEAIQLSPEMCYGPGEEIPKQPMPQGILNRPQTEPFWRMGKQSMTSLFCALQKTQPCSLVQTRENLNKRRQLRDKLNKIHQQMGNRSKSIGNLRQLVNAAITESSAVEENKDFMSEGKRNVVYKEIRSAPTFEYRIRTVQTKTTGHETKSAYKSALSKLGRLEHEIARAWNDIAKDEEAIVSCIQECQLLVRQLDQISLCGTIMEDENFYTEQKESELSEQVDGWQIRVNFLTSLEAIAQYCHHIVQSDTATAAGDAIFSASRDTLQTSDVPSIRTAQRKCTVPGAQEKLERIEDMLGWLMRNGIVEASQRKSIMARYTWWRYGCCPATRFDSIRFPLLPIDERR